MLATLCNHKQTYIKIHKQPSTVMDYIPIVLLALMKYIGYICNHKQTYIKIHK